MRNFMELNLYIINFEVLFTEKHSDFTVKEIFVRSIY